MSQKREKWQQQREELRHQESMSLSRKQTRYALYALLLSIGATTIGLFTFLANNERPTEPSGDDSSSEVLTYVVSTSTSFRPPSTEEAEESDQPSLITSSGADAEDPEDALFSPSSSPHLVVEASLTGPAPPPGDTIWVFLSPDQGMSWWIKPAEPDGQGKYVARFRRDPSTDVSDDLVAAVVVGAPDQHTPSTDYRPPRTGSDLATQSAGSPQQDSYFNYSGDAIDPVPVDFEGLPISAQVTFSLEPLED